MKAEKQRSGPLRYANPRGRRLLSALPVLALLFAPDAEAQDIAGAFRLALEGNVLAYDNITLSAPTGTGSVTTLNTSLGLPGTAVGVGLGYGAAPNVLLGGRVSVSSTHSKVGDMAVDGASVALFPHVEYVFDGNSVRPFISANLGFSSAGASAGGVDSSTSAFLIGPGAGVHGFATSTFSVDAGLMALLQKGSSKQGDAELDASGYSVLVTIAVSGWLGGSKSESATRAAVPLVERPVARDDGPSVVEQQGSLESTFTLDLPNAAGGGVRVAIQGDPKVDATRVRVTVTWLRPHDQSAACGAVALEIAGARTELSDVQTSARGGFGSVQVTQRGSLPFDTLGALVDPEQEARLVLCDERVLVLPAAKRRVKRFTQVFGGRVGAAQP